MGCGASRSGPAGVPDASPEQAQAIDRIARQIAESKGCTTKDDATDDGAQDQEQETAPAAAAASGAPHADSTDFVALVPEAR